MYSFNTGTLMSVGVQEHFIRDWCFAKHNLKQNDYIYEIKFEYFEM